MPNRLPVSNNLLKTVMEKQEQMLLLDLEIKKATMEKQLREIQGSVLDAEIFNEKISLPPAIIQTIPYEEKIEDAIPPALNRIRRHDGFMQATLTLSNGATIFAKEGNVISERWKITNISQSSVMAIDIKKQKAKPFELQFAPSFTSGDSKNTTQGPYITGPKLNNAATGFGLPSANF